MQIFIDPSTKQVMAVYKGCRADPSAWPGCVEKYAPDNMPASRDLKVTLDGEGEVTAWEASENPVKPAPRKKAPTPTEIIVEAAKAAGLTLDLEAAKQRLSAKPG